MIDQVLATARSHVERVLQRAGLPWLRESRGYRLGQREFKRVELAFKEELKALLACRLIVQVSCWARDEHLKRTEPIRVWWVLRWPNVDRYLRRHSRKFVRLKIAARDFNVSGAVDAQ